MKFQEAYEKGLNESVEFTIYTENENGTVNEKFEYLHGVPYIDGREMLFDGWIPLRWLERTDWKYKQGTDLLEHQI